MDGLFGKAGVWQLKTAEDAEMFQRAPARAKVLLFYWLDCRWCKEFAPEYARIAPPSFDSTRGKITPLIVGAVERASVRAIQEVLHLPMPPMMGFPHTVMLNNENQIIHTFRSRTAPEFAKELFAAMPSLADEPGLRYLHALESYSRPMVVMGDAKSITATTATTATRGAAMPFAHRHGGCVGFAPKPERTSKQKPSRKEWCAVM